MSNSKEELLQLMNDQNGLTELRALTFQEVEFEPPEVLVDAIANAYGRNSSVLVYNIDLPTNNRMQFYNRLDIADLFGNYKVPIEPDIETAEQALEALNEHYGLKLESEDIETLELLDDFTVDLVISQSSYKYFPGSKINIYGNGEVSKFELSVSRYWYMLNVTIPQIVNKSDETS